MAAESPKEPHCGVLVFPFGGHARPMLGLVCKLAQMLPDVKFSFFNTEKSNKIMFSKEGGNLPHNIKAYNLQVDVDENPNSVGNPHEPVDAFLRMAPLNFKKSMDMVEAEEGTRFSFILADSFLPFAGDMAEERHIPWGFLWVSMPYSLYVYSNIEQIYQVCLNSTSITQGNQEPDIDIIPGLPAIQQTDLPEGILTPGEFSGSVLLDSLCHIGQVMQGANVVLMNFHEELDPTALANHFMSTTPNLLYMGFLTLLSCPTPSQQSLDSTIAETCLSWLDSQKDRSVVYISFGTVVLPHQDEISALANALEESGTPYLWSLRDYRNKLFPVGFVDRTSMRGKVVTWAPQAEVLAHPSIAVFITHGGSNSIYESIAAGVVMICRPFFGDHKMNGRVVAEVWRVGICLEEGKITKDGMLKSLERIMAHEQGTEMRENAQVLKTIIQEASGPDGKATQSFSTLAKMIAESQAK